MKKTPMQIPDELYQRAKQVAREREMSFAELTRRGHEYITSVYSPVDKTNWKLPLIGNSPRAQVSQEAISQAIAADRDRLP
ncbi:MAG: hypothetical protein ACOCVG_00635 [Verrucomicrobiota bacterium]